MKEKSTRSATPHASDDHKQKPDEKKPAGKKKDWVRLSEERRFGSITGSNVRVWGDE
jgi:hypothetical protein